MSMKKFTNSFLKYFHNKIQYPMPNQKYFHNPFQDYNAENATNLISDNKLHPQSKLALGLNKKWENTIKDLENVIEADYTVYTGIAGVALLKLKHDPDNMQNLKDVKQLLFLNKLRDKGHTFLCGDAGTIAIGIVVNDKLGKSQEVEELTNRLKAMLKDVLNTSSGLPNEYMYGRAGYLYALLFVNKHTSSAPFNDATIREVVEAILLCGKIESNAPNFPCPLMYQWHGSYYLGAAHGVSGIIYLLLQAKQYVFEEELNTLIKPTIDYLSSLRFSSGNYPSSLGRDTDKYVQWCHGAPGFLYMFTSAYKVFGDARYLELALECGEVIWKRGLLKKGYSICHGVSGNGYCFLELFQTTQDPKHLYRAIKFGEWCLEYTRDHEDYPPDRPLSLYEGMAGPLYYLLDIQDPMEAKFPGFTL